MQPTDSPVPRPGQPPSLEVLLDDQSRRWQEGDRCLVEAYLHSYPDLAGDPQRLLELIQHEVALRQASGETPQLDEYLRRFPDLAGPIRERFEHSLAHGLDAPPPFVADNDRRLAASPGSAAAPARPQIQSAAALLAAIGQARLLTPAQLEELTQQLQPRHIDARSLARDLLQRGWLTPYQLNQLLQGKGMQLGLGQYVLLERLGEGGMGQVFKARHQKLDRVVALKLIRPEQLADGNAVRRFHREVRAVAQLSHPHVVHAFDADQVGATHLLVMEYVEGSDLHALVKKNGPLPVAVACDYLRQAALGLQHAHEHGLVHRDIKPSNLLLSRSRPPGAAPSAAGQATPFEGVVKILDLGLARLKEPGSEGESSATLTNSAAVMGTPDYIAPEQARQSHGVDIRADLYSLGCTLYFLLTGRPPFAGGSVGEKLIKHQLDEPEPVEHLRPEVPGGVAGVLRKLMAKRPEDRYQTPAELAAVLAEGLRTGSWPAPLAAVVPAVSEAVPFAVPLAAAGSGFSSIMDPPTQVGTGDTSRRLREQAERRRWRWQLAGGGLAALLSLGVLAFLLLRDHRSAPPTEARAAQPSAMPVAADQPWQDTGVDVMAGDTVALRPEKSLWRKGQQACAAAGLEQAPRDRCVLPEAPYLCLLVRVGDEPEPAAVLPAGKLKATRTGRLYLQANDLDLAGNSGSLKVAIDGGLRSDQAAPPPGPTRVEAAEAAWRPLRDKARGPKADLEALRKALVGFRTEYSGTPQVVAAAEVLSTVLTRLPSPLDKLDPTRIPAEDLLSLGVGDRKQAPAGLAAIVGETRWRHPGGVHSVAFSADGKMVASGGADPVIRLWDVTTGHERVFCRGHTAPVAAVAFAPNGRALASASHDKTVRVWDVATGKELALGTHTAALQCVAWSTDSRRLAAGGDDQVINLWDPANIGAGKQLACLSTLKGHTQPVQSVAFSPAGDRLASGAGQFHSDVTGELKLWDLAGGNKPLDLPVPDRVNVVVVAFSPTGQLLDSERFDVKVRDGASGKVLASLPVNVSSGVTDVSVSRDGKMVAAGSHMQWTYLLDLESRKVTHVIPLIAGKVSVAFAPDGKTLATGHSEAGLVQLWDLTGAEPRDKTGLTGHTHIVQAAAFSSDGRTLATMSADLTVRRWDLTGAEAREAVSFPHQVPSFVRAAAFAPDNQTLAIGDARAVRLWDLRGKIARERWVLEAPCVESLAFAPDGRSIAFGCRDQTLRLCDVTGTGPRERAVFHGHNGWVYAVAFSPDGQLLASGNQDGSVCLWWAAGQPGKELAVLKGHGGVVGALALAPGGQLLASGGNDNTVRLWELRGAKTRERAVLKDHKSGVTSVAFSPDGRMLGSTAFDGRILVWDPASGKVIADWQLPGPVYRLVFAPDGRHLAVANTNGAVFIFRLAPAPRP